MKPQSLSVKYGRAKMPLYILVEADSRKGQVASTGHTQEPSAPDL